MLPLVAAAVGLGVGATPADAAICSPLSSASITGPSGTITAGSTVHASARVSGMLLTAHMQITGPGLDQQVGPSTIAGTIDGAVRVPQPGVFTLKVLGNGTGCVYDSDAFSVKARPSASEPTPHGAAGASSAPGASRTSKLSRGIRDGATSGPKLPSGKPPFRLPAVAPDGTGPSVHYPSADPQVAAPPIKQPQPRADNAAHTVPPIKWGQSIGIALILLLLSAHMGMWSRRQRLAEAGARRGQGTRRARRANADRQMTARMPLASDHPAVPRDADRTAEPRDGHTPPPSGTGYTGTQQHRDHGQRGHMPPSDRPGAAPPAGHASVIGQENWDDPRGAVDRTDLSGSLGQMGQGGWDDPRGAVGRTDLSGSLGQTGQSGWDDSRGHAGTASRSTSLGQNGWGDPAGQVTGRPAPTGSTGEYGTVDWESWVGRRRQLSAEDRANPRGWADTADQDGRGGLGGRDAHVHPGGEMAGQPAPYPLDSPAQPGRVRDGGRVRGERADAIGWTMAPPAGAVDGSGAGAETGRVGSAGRGGPAVSLDRATRSGRGYRGRRRRS